MAPDVIRRLDQEHADRVGTAVAHERICTLRVGGTEEALGALDQKAFDCVVLVGDLETVVDGVATKGGAETILVVEDDEDVRTTVIEMLSSLGYNVLKARNALSALAIVEKTRQAMGGKGALE